MGTDEFHELARLEARNRGLAALPTVVVKHPLGGIKPDEVERKADTIVEAVAQALCGETTPGRGGSP